ncbi:hybrid sensor histidine kinase/response regulator [Chryseolinea soli]|uniref:histidine kinase n=2 Tax=Chryseolinea soli TaxID=2321403 RepID=A0A385SCY2_9BACT|nr:hybrid sensor histidine kinase/response regulator [Chryseolinea soli]
MTMNTTLRILILEDVQDDVVLIEYALRKDGIQFEAQQVDSQELFVRALHEFNPDVILSDHSLPQFNSMEALKLCRAQGLDIPFILVTGTMSEEFAVSCLKEGADDYVLKLNLTRLSSAIINAIKQKKIDAERKEAEKALQRQNKELVKINEELDKFVYSVSHNLRAPLTSVLGLVNIGRLEDGKREDSFLPLFDMMEKSIRKLDATLKEILNYSRNARGDINIEKVDLAPIIQTCLESSEFIEGYDQVKKEVFIRNEETPFYSDSHRLSVIFDDLVSNAIRYRDIRKKQSTLTIEAEITANAAHILFKDNGIGIPEELVPRIFEMFFRATEKSEGAGLGLYIVKEMTKKLGGTIQVITVFGEGTTFRLEIPNAFPGRTQSNLN